MGVLSSFPPSCFTLPSVCQKISILCDSLTILDGQSIDMFELTFQMVTKVISTICFNLSYKYGDPELEIMQKFNMEILDSLARIL